MMDTTKVDNRFLHGIVLAGGEGSRLQLYVQESECCEFFGDPVKAKQKRFKPCLTS
jgi:hypothetical protein